jgi:hypothetical protein
MTLIARRSPALAALALAALLSAPVAAHAAGRTLDVEVTNVELAGELEPFGRFHDEVRVLRGRADWPRISLRYTLSEGASTLASGQADLSDPDYFHRLPRSGHQGVLGYEKRMLDDWVASLVATAPPR